MKLRKLLLVPVSLPGPVIIPRYLMREESRIPRLVSGLRTRRRRKCAILHVKRADTRYEYEFTAKWDFRASITRPRNRKTRN